MAYMLSLIICWTSFSIVTSAMLNKHSINGASTVIHLSHVTASSTANWSNSNSIYNLQPFHRVVQGNNEEIVLIASVRHAAGCANPVLACCLVNQLPDFACSSASAGLIPSSIIELNGEASHNTV